VSDFDWSDEKNEILKTARGVSFEEVVFHIHNGDVLDILRHPNKARYPNQNIIERCGSKRKYRSLESLSCRA